MASVSFWTTSTWSASLIQDAGILCEMIGDWILDSFLLVNAACGMWPVLLLTSTCTLVPGTAGSARCTGSCESLVFIPLGRPRGELAL